MILSRIYTAASPAQPGSSAERANRVAALFFFGEGGSVSGIVQNLLSMRGDSNSTREALYARSVELTLEESPLLGLGIKDVEAGPTIPLGSHSTYVGVFYRIGILGSLAFLALTLLATKRVFRSRSGLAVASFLCLLAFCAVEDVDGLDWVLMCVSLFVALPAFGESACAPERPAPSRAKDMMRRAALASGASYERRGAGCR